MYKIQETTGTCIIDSKEARLLCVYRVGFLFGWNCPSQLQPKVNRCWLSVCSRDITDFRHFNFVFTSKRESFSRKFVSY